MSKMPPIHQGLHHYVMALEKRMDAVEEENLLFKGVLSRLLPRLEKVEKENGELRGLLLQIQVGGVGGGGGGGGGAMRREFLFLEELNRPENVALQQAKQYPTFTDWLKGLVFVNTKDYLTTVFENDILYGIGRLMEDCIYGTELDELPIRVFSRDLGRKGGCSTYLIGGLLIEEEKAEGKEIKKMTIIIPIGNV